MANLKLSRGKRWWAWGVFALLALFVGSPALYSTRSALVNSDTFVLYSVQPNSEEPLANPNHPRFYYGTHIMGQTTITDPHLKAQLVDGIYQTLQADGTLGAACLVPRYGIRATKGWRTIDMIICFDCGNVVFHQYGKDGRIIHMQNNNVRPLFDRVLREAGVPQSKRHE